MIDSACPVCGRMLPAVTATGGRSGKCPYCGTIVAAGPDVAAPGPGAVRFTSCADCGEPNDENNRWCSRCGHELFGAARWKDTAPRHEGAAAGRVRCQQCGTRNPMSAQTCLVCGQYLHVRQRVGGHRPRINTHLLESALVALFCCMPLGIVAIAYASRASDLIEAGDDVGAAVAARKAQRFCNLGLTSAIVICVLLMLRGTCAAPVAL